MGNVLIAYVYGLHAFIASIRVHKIVLNPTNTHGKLQHNNCADSLQPIYKPLDEARADALLVKRAL